VAVALTCPPEAVDPRLHATLEYSLNLVSKLTLPMPTLILSFLISSLQWGEDNSSPHVHDLPEHRGGHTGLAVLVQPRVESFEQGCLPTPTSCLFEREFGTWVQRETVKEVM
jgi:hypothetical protein